MSEHDPDNAHKPLVLLVDDEPGCSSFSPG